MSEQKPSLKTRVLHEIKEMGILFLYLAVLLCAFTTYRMLILSEYHIGYQHYAYSIFEALVLSKVIIIGRMLKIGERHGARPLIIPALYKTITFSLFIIAFTLLEHLCDGLIHHESIATVRDRLLSIGIREMLARALVLCSALIPLFMMEEVGNVIGEGKMFEWMFVRRPSVPMPEHSTI
jgi:hypothetical protein